MMNLKIVLSVVLLIQNIKIFEVVADLSGFVKVGTYDGLTKNGSSFHSTYYMNTNSGNNVSYILFPEYETKFNCNFFIS